MKRRDVTGTVVMITGAAGGLGRALAFAFAAAGARIAALDINAEGAQAVAAELRGQGRQSLGFAWWVSRLAPAYYAHAMARRLRGEMDGE